MITALDPLRELSMVSVLLRLLLAMVCGGLIGMERGKNAARRGFAPICSCVSARRSA